MGHNNKNKALNNEILKLTQENKELNEKLETYLEEMEELDKKNEHLEIEQNKLLHEYQQLKSIELVGSNITELQELECRNEELGRKLKKEMEKRETVENELFKIEEEYESFKISIEESESKLEAEIERVQNDLFGRKTSTNSLSSQDSDFISYEAGLKFMIKKKQRLLDNLQKENDVLSEKVRAYEQVRKIFMDSFSPLSILSFRF